MSEQTTPSVTQIDPANPGRQHLFKISQTLDENRTLDLKPVYISLGLAPSAFPAELGGVPDSAPSPYGSPKSVFDSALRGTGQLADRIWLFKGNTYLRYFEKPDGNDVIEGPLNLATDWQLPPSFSGLTAALRGTGAFEGKYYFFSGNQYLRFDVATDSPQGFAPIAGNWRGLSDEFGQGIDAALHGEGDYYGVCWLFKGSQYQRYNMNSDEAEGPPKPIAGNWGGTTWPAEFANGIDFAFYGTGTDAHRIYFSRGDKFILYNLKTDQVEQGPQPITRNWPGLARFMPQPQLFISEQYNLRMFRGEMGVGEIIKSESIAPGGSSEFYIVTKKSSETQESSSSNVLESQSEQSAESFSESTNNDATESSSEDKYDYNMDASFHGEASVTFGGGEADADLNVKGGSQDVRNAFAKAVRKQLGNQASKTQETHRQQVSAQGSNYAVKTEVETGFKQTIDNSRNPNGLNMFVFQVTQEYIVVLTLVDAQLAFRNGNSREALSAPIRDMASLLERCIIDPNLRSRIAATVIDTLSNVSDYAGQVRSLLAPAPGTPGRFQIDKVSTSSYEAKDSTGAPLRSVVVPGVISSVDRPVILTANTAMGTA